MEFIDLITYATPIMSVVLIITIYFNFKMDSLSKKYEDYKNDKFRQSIEKQISELTRELTVNEKRFSSINHLLSDAQASSLGDMNKYSINNKTVNTDVFLKNLGLSHIPSVNEEKVFVLTPFNEEYLSQYEAIKDVVIDFGFSCTRGDDEKLSSNILSHIVEQIASSRIVIANISGRNPNVFYELGIAHALGKPVVIVSESLVNIPFDISNSRILAFENIENLKKELRVWFVKTIAKT
ncbi:hypothetical protein [Aeromonas sp. 30P]|uniref:hypothetical protein n=1 Tax=Aeromonas sp. 30P TaxID=3452717 RepID=UPI0038EE10AC